MTKHRTIFSIDDYACRSPLKTLSPAFKVLFTMAALFLCIWEDHMAVSAFAVISMAAVNILRNRVRPGEYLSLMGIPLTFIIMGAAAIAVHIEHGENGWRILFPPADAVRAVRVMFRALGAVSILYFLALSTPMHEIISVLRRFHVPKIITELMSMVYRYIFILMDTQLRLKAAAVSRMGYCDFKTSLKTFGSSLGSLLVISLKRAGRYYDALESRGYDGEILYLEEPKQIRPAHVAWACCCLAAMVSIPLLLPRLR